MQKKALILVVCRGNIGRSPFAEAVIKQELVKRGLEREYRVESRGTQGTLVDPGRVEFPNITHYKHLYADAKPVLDELGVDMSHHVSRSIERSDAEQADILLAMDDKVLDGLHTLFPDQISKIHLLSELIGKRQNITDPESVSGKDVQAQIFTSIRDTIVQGFPQLLHLTRR